MFIICKYVFVSLEGKGGDGFGGIRLEEKLEKFLIKIESSFVENDK